MSTATVKSRSHVYAELIREFRDANPDNDWVDILDLVPKTKRWATWRTECSKYTSPPEDAQALFRRISEDGTLDPQISEGSAT